MADFQFYGKDGRTYTVSGADNEQQAKAEFDARWDTPEMEQVRQNKYANESWGDRFNIIGQRASDLGREFSDSATRGWGDKLYDATHPGSNEQQATADARARTGGWNALPADIAGIAVSTPYRVGSTLWGAGAGAAEGAATAYGHQKNWVPSAEDAWNIAKGAGLGLVTGGIGGAIGGKAGTSQATKEANAAHPYPTDADLHAAAAADPANAELAARSQDVKNIRTWSGTPRDQFAKTIADADLAPGVAETAANIARPSLVSKASDLANQIPKGASGTALVTEAIAHGGIPWWSLGAWGAKKGLNMAAERAANVSPAEIDQLAAQARGAVTPDQLLIDSWRNRAAQAGIGAARTYESQ